MNSPALSLITQDCDEVTKKSVNLLEGLKKEKILITGGTGFMGTWLTELIMFLNDNYDFGVKLFLISRNANQFALKAPHLAKRKEIILIERDIRNLIDIPDETTYIIHAAANPDNRQHSSEPLKVMEVIAKGTDLVLAAASRNPNIKKILNISSGLIYGPQPLELEKIPETFHGGPDCDSIVSIYPEAKRFAETLCTAYRNQFKLPIVTTRPFAFIGPYQLLDKPWAINNFIRDSLLGVPIHILGDEQTVRSYMYASDLAFWILRILVAGDSAVAYNLGSPCGITLKQLAQKIAANFPRPPKIISDEQSAGQLRRSRLVPDITLAQKNLGLNVSVNLDEAIKRTITWFIENSVGPDKVQFKG